MAYAIRLNTYLSSAQLDNLLDYVQSETYPLAIHLGGPLELTESIEQLRQVLIGNPNACVFHYDNYHSLVNLVRRKYLYLSAFRCKL